MRTARFETELVALIDERGKIVKRKGEAVEGVGIFDDRGRDYAGGFDARGFAYGSDVDADDTILLLDGSRSKFKVGKKYRIATTNREAVARELLAVARELTAKVEVTDKDIAKIEGMTARNDHVGALMYLWDKVLKNKKVVKGLQAFSDLADYLGYQTPDMSRLRYEQFYEPAMKVLKRELDPETYEKIHMAF